MVTRQNPDGSWTDIETNTRWADSEMTDAERITARYNEERIEEFQKTGIWER